MKIRTYDQQVNPQDEIGGVRATGADFGSQVGEAEQELGGAVQQVADQQIDLAAARDQVWRNQAVSDYQLKQTQALQSAATDPDFAKKYGADGQGFTAGFGEQLTTNMNNLTSAAPSPRSARLLQEELTNVNTSIMGKAQAFQAQQGGAYMKQQVSTMMQNDAKTVEMDPTQASQVMDRGKVAIANLPLLDNDTRSELIKTYEQNIALSAGKSMVLHKPEAVLASIAPDVMANFKQTPRVASAEGVNAGVPANPVTAFAPPTTVSAQVQSYTPLIKTSAAKSGIDANLLAAQIQKESGGDPNAVNNADIAVTGQPSVGIAQFQPATAAQYGVTNPKDPNQAIPGMAAYMSDLLKQFGGDYTKALAAYNWGQGHLTQAIAQYGTDWQQHIPASTQDYIAEIYKNAAPSSSADQSLATLQQQSAAAEPSRAPTNPDWFNRLNWEQQFAIVHDAEQGVRANQVRDAQNAALTEQQHKQQQQKLMNDMFNRIGATGDGANPLTVDQVKSADLDYQNKEHMLTAINAVSRGEMATDPAVFNTLFQRIHLPSGDPNKLADDDALLPYVGKGLSVSDLGVLRGEMRGKNTPDGAALTELKKNFFKMAGDQISPSVFLGSKDPTGVQNFYNFQQDAIMTLDKAQRAGEDPMDYLNPKNSKYLGNKIPLYQRTPQQQMQDYSARMTGATAGAKAIVTPRQANESAADYLKRTQGK